MKIKIGVWFKNSKPVHETARVLQNLLLQKFNKYFPQKKHKINQPWISHKLKGLDQRREREYHKHRISEKWLILNQDFKESVRCAKKYFYKSMMKDLIKILHIGTQALKWRGVLTSPKRNNDGGPQGATLGILEYISQTNNSADCVNPEERFKLVDDLTVLDIVNLMTIGYDFQFHKQLPA